MAADAIVHDDLGAGILGGRHLRLAERKEGSRVLHTVETLECILARHVLMRDVAVVTGGDGAFTPSMRRVVPSGIIGLHDMAVDTGRRVVSQVRGKTQHVQEETSGPDKNARQT